MGPEGTQREVAAWHSPAGQGVKVGDLEGEKVGESEGEKVGDLEGE